MPLSNSILRKSTGAVYGVCVGEQRHPLCQLVVRHLNQAARFRSAFMPRPTCTTAEPNRAALPGFRFGEYFVNDEPGSYPCQSAERDVIGQLSRASRVHWSI